MSMYDKKVSEFTRWSEPLPRPPTEEIWHTLEDYTAKVLFFHKGHKIDMSGSTWSGATLEDAVNHAVESARAYARSYEIDENSTLQIIAVGCAYHTDRRLIKKGDPEKFWDPDQYDESSNASYRGNRRLVTGPIVGYASDPNFAELPADFLEHFEDL